MQVRGSGHPNFRGREIATHPGGLVIICRFKWSDNRLVFRCLQQVLEALSMTLWPNRDKVSAPSTAISIYTTGRAIPTFELSKCVRVSAYIFGPPDRSAGPSFYKRADPALSKRAILAPFCARDNPTTLWTNILFDPHHVLQRDTLLLWSSWIWTHSLNLALSEPLRVVRDAAARFRWINQVQEARHMMFLQLALSTIIAVEPLNAWSPNLLHTSWQGKEATA